MLDPMGAGVVGQELQELGAEAPTLVLVGHGESHLSGPVLVRLAVVAGQPDHPAVQDRDQCHPIRVIDIREELDFLRLEGLLDPEEPEVPGFRAESLEEFDQERPVTSLDRPDPRSAAVPERYIEFVLGWVFGHHGTLPRLAWGQYPVSAYNSEPRG